MRKETDAFVLCDFRMSAKQRGRVIAILMTKKARKERRRNLNCILISSKDVYGENANLNDQAKERKERRKENVLRSTRAGWRSRDAE